MLGADRVQLHDIASADVHQMPNYQFLLFGIPTWDYGELQEDWDDIWDELDNVSLPATPAAIFGLGDAKGYPDWYQDAMGYLHHKLQAMGAELTGYWPSQGYQFNKSLALTADQKFFLGLALDEENFPELSEERLSRWLNELFPAIKTTV